MHRVMKREVVNTKNTLWKSRYEEINMYLGRTKISEAWKMVTNLRKEETQKCGLSLDHLLRATGKILHRIIL